MKDDAMKKSMTCALAWAVAAVASSLGAKTLSEGPWLDVSKARLSESSAGNVHAADDGWLEWTPAAADEDVALRIPFPDVRFRAFNQFYMEVDNGNGDFEADVRLATARPKHNELKGKRTIEKGRQAIESHFPGVGAPARLREAKILVERDVLSRLVKPIRVRCRMRLTDYNYDKTIGSASELAMDYVPAAGFTSRELSEGEKIRAKFKAKAESVKKTLNSAAPSTSAAIKGYEALCIIRDQAPRMIELACLNEAAERDRKKGVLLHGVATGTDKVARDDVFCGAFRCEASVSAARGESEGVQIVLHPDVEVKGVEFAVSTLRTKKGAELPPSAVSIAPVGYITLTDPAYIPPRQFRLAAPDPILLHVKRVDLEARRFQPFYVDVSVPAEAVPGVYTGYVAFRDATKKLTAKVPLSVTVHPFELPRCRTFPMVFSSPTFSMKNPLVRLYAKDEADVGRYKSFLEGMDGDVSRQPEGVRALWDVAMGMHRLLRDHNIPTQDIYGSVRNVDPPWLRKIQVADSPNWYCIGYDNAKPIVERVGAHMRPMRREGVSKAAYLYGFDEIRMSDKKAFAGMKADYAAVKAAFPEIRTMCTALDGSFGVNSDTEQEVDCWVWPSDGYAGSRRNAERARARGKQVWYYPCNWPYHPHANLHLENLGTATRVLCGLYPWKYKADGMLYYATAMMRVQKSWVDETGLEQEKRIDDPKMLGDGPVFGPEHCYSMHRSNGDGTLLYPTQTGVIPSIRIKEVRDGVDDYEYLVLLDCAAKNVKDGKVKVRDPKDFLSKAERLLFVDDQLCRGDTRYPETGVAICEWRDAVAALVSEAWTGTGK